MIYTTPCVVCGEATQVDYGTCLECAVQAYLAATPHEVERFVDESGVYDLEGNRVES